MDDVLGLGYVQPVLNYPNINFSKTLSRLTSVNVFTASVHFTHFLFNYTDTKTSYVSTKIQAEMLSEYNHCLKALSS